MKKLAFRGSPEATERSLFSSSNLDDAVQTSNCLKFTAVYDPHDVKFSSAFLFFSFFIRYNSESIPAIFLLLNFFFFSLERLSSIDYGSISKV